MSIDSATRNSSIRDCTAIQESKEILNAVIPIVLQKSGEEQGKELAAMVFDASQRANINILAMHTTAAEIKRKEFKPKDAERKKVERRKKKEDNLTQRMNLNSHGCRRLRPSRSSLTRNTRSWSES
jgi:hypothetical protein